MVVIVIVVVVFVGDGRTQVALAAVVALLATAATSTSTSATTASSTGPRAPPALQLTPGVGHELRIVVVLAAGLVASAVVTHLEADFGLVVYDGSHMT